MPVQKAFHHLCHTMTPIFQDNTKIFCLSDSNDKESKNKEIGLGENESNAK